jgi:hypothetical protein
MQKRVSCLAVITVLVLLAGTASVFAQEMTCTDCHNDTTIITGKQTGLSEAVHGTGEAYVRGTSASCAGCHSGGAFSKMIAAGLSPNQVEAGDPNPTRQDCRTCHQIHVNYTSDDWALETTAAVDLFAFEGVTYKGGKGNLCANCHQPRRAIAEADADGNIAVTSTHWGPHHGPQSAMMLGIGGAGAEGSASIHSFLVKDTCVTCHVGANGSHTFEPVLASCQECHQDATNFDIGGVQTTVEELIAEVGELLVTKGLLDDEGHPVVGVYPAAEAAALWDYIFISIEDGSLGVHNAEYTIALLEAAKEALQ